VTQFEVQVHLDREETHPKVFTHAVIEHLITGHNIDEAAVVRSIELSITRYCPGYAMMSKVIPIRLKYQIFEGDGVEGRKLVKSGEYQPPVNLPSETA
jgi:uncharacterized OsmC-like protein